MSRFLASGSIVWATVLLVTPLSAGAELTYLTSSYETLYRVTVDGSVESWEFPGIKLRGMHRDLATGQIVLLGDEGGSAPETVYIVNNPVSGTPTLATYAVLTQHYATLTQIDEAYYAFGHGDLYTIDLSDPANPIETYVGATGLSGTGGAAYDADSDTLYMVSYLTNTLYTVDPGTAAVTAVGEMGISTGGLGAEWFENELYIAVQNYSSGNLEIGKLEPSSGWYSPSYTVADGAANVATALTVIPEPGGLVLLLAGCLAFMRRRG